MRKKNFLAKLMVIPILIFFTLYSFSVPQQSQEQIEIENLIRMGWQLYDRNEIDKALEIYNKALEECKRIDYKEGEIILNWNIAEALKLKGEFLLAKNHYEKSLEISRDVGDKWSEAMALGSLGHLYSLDMGNMYQALAYFEAALKIEIQINDEVGENYTLGSMGYIYGTLGNYSKALEYFKRLLKLSRKINNKKFEYEALELIGDTYMHLKDIEKAIYYFDKSLKLAIEINNPKYQKTIFSKFGTLNGLLGNYKVALDAFNKGLDISKTSGNKREQANFQGYIAGIYQKLGQYTKAINYFNKALENYKELNDVAAENLSLLRIGEIYCFLNNHQETLKLILPALKIAKNFNNKHALMWGFYYAGIAYMNLGKNDKALFFLKDSVNTLESIREKIQEEKHRIFYFESNNIIYEKTILLLSYLYSKEQSKDVAKESFIYSEKAKARTLLEMLSEAKFGVRMGLDQKGLEYKNYLYQNLENLRNSRMDATKDQVININRKLRAAEEELEEFKIKIRKSDPLYASIQYPQSLTVEDVQNKVLRNKTEAILEYYTGMDNSFLFIITKENYEFVILRKTNSELAEDLERLRKPLVKVAESILELNKYDLGTAYNLYQELIAPAIPYLKGINHLVIIPHGCLNYLPFEMLVGKINDGETKDSMLLSEYSRPRYLIEDFSISYAPSASALDPNLFSSTLDRPKKGDIFAIANPDFKEISAVKRDKEITDLFLTKSMREKIIQLAFSEQEVEEIAQYFENPLIFVNNEATEYNFVREAPNYPIIHISTHGFLNETHPVYSSLVFAFNEEMKDVDLLHAYEIFNLDLDCNLITLSACETALGQKMEFVGGEGVVGLSRAFLYAGAKSLVVSLWKVEDESTSILMSEFYKNLKEKGLSKVEALREAKLALMKKGKKIGSRTLSYSHPFFWAPFILIGESN